MKLTKVNGTYHTKEKIENQDNTIGKLVNKKSNTLEIVKDRFATQVESRIHKEFLSLKKGRINGKEKYGDLYGLYELFLLLKMLYLNSLGKNTKDINEKINVNNLKNIDMEKIKEDKNIIKRYKLNKDNYLVKLENGGTSKSFLDMFLNLQKEIKDCKDITKLSSYKELEEMFSKYVNRKIDYIVKSLENNKAFVMAQDKEIEILDENLKAQFYLQLIEKCKSDTTRDLFEEEIGKYLKNINREIKRIVEIIGDNKIHTDKKIKELYKVIREKKSEKNGDDYEDTWNKLLEEELEIFVTGVISKSKRKIKELQGTGKKDDKLYDNYLFKQLGDAGKLELKIKENFKNRFVSRILEIGKYMHYLKKKVVISKELEFIKAKESLISKLATIMSFAIHSYNRLWKDDISYYYLLEKVGENFCIFDTINIDPRKVEYYFSGIEDFTPEEKKFFIKMLHDSLYGYRLQVAHFDREDKVGEIDEKKYSESNEKFRDEDTKKTYNYLNGIEDEVVSNLKEKFNSNNLEFYYEKEEIEKYFNIYQCDLLKAKVPYAPNFKRIVEKGEKLYQNNDKRYKYFFIFKDEEEQDNIEKQQLYINTKNYLLKELYYNNFFKEFLNEKSGLFKKAIINAKARKQRFKNGSNKKSGVAYDQFENFKSKDSISEYVANIHKMEMNKLGEEKYNQNNTKEKSQYINEYLEDIFLEGFILWLEREKLYFLACKDRVGKLETEKDEEYNYNIKFEMNVNLKDKKVLMIFFVLSFVDNKRITEFANELVKYNQYVSKKTDSKSMFLGTEIDDWREICELVLLVRERISLKEEEIVREEKGQNNHLVNKYYGDNENYFKVVEKFVDNEIIKESYNIKEGENLLYHHTDGKTPILYGNLEKTRKFGLNTLIENMDYKKYSLKERKEYKEGNKKESIEELQKQKAKLHLEWENYKKSKKEENIKFDSTSKEKYEDICKKIRRYDYLRKKQTMYIPFQLHEIASDIQARFLGYIVKQERDFEYFKLVLGIPKYKGMKKEEEIEKIYENKFLANTFKKEAYEIRNYIAHFHHYIDENGKKSKYSFIRQMNMLIEFLNYNRKIKNHINNSIKRILEKYNMEISFKRIDNEDGTFEYVIDEIRSKKGKMLGEKNKFEIVEEEFIEEVKKMLDYGRKLDG